MGVIGNMFFEPEKVPDFGLGGRDNHVHVLRKPRHGEIRLNPAPLVEPLGIHHPTWRHVNVVGTDQVQHAGSVTPLQPKFGKGGLIK